MGPPAAPSAPVKPDRVAAQQAGRRVRRGRRARRRTPPEPGRGGRRPWAALVGVAPRNRNLGQRRGPRGAGSGCAAVDRILSTAAVTAIRHHPAVRAFCTRPCAKGPPGPVALGAAMRRRLTVLHGSNLGHHHLLAQGRVWRFNERSGRMFRPAAAALRHGVQDFRLIAAWKQGVKVLRIGL